VHFEAVHCGTYDWLKDIRAAAQGGPPRAWSVGNASEAVHGGTQDWFRDISLLQFLREVGKHARVGAMLSRDAVKSRMEADGEGISFTE
jgi:tyrosyl-tRNA synthetase